MTAKKQSLLKKGVMKKDYSDSVRLTDPSNVNQELLENFAIESARFATEGKMPHYESKKPNCLVVSLTLLNQLALHATPTSL